MKMHGNLLLYMIQVVLRYYICTVLCLNLKVKVDFSLHNL